MPPRVPITRPLVFGQARDLVNERGADALTMRALASTLGIEAPSLYKHVKGKDQILDGICELVYNDIEVDLVGCDTWEDRLREYCRAYRLALLKNSRCVPILAIRPIATESAMGVVEVTLQEFADIGFDPDTAWQLLNVVAAFVIGHVLAEVGDNPMSEEMQDHLTGFRQELNPAAYPLASATIGDRQPARTQEFELALDLLIAGIGSRFPAVIERPAAALAN